MFGFWEWLLILAVIAWVALPWWTRKNANRRRVNARREGQVNSTKSPHSGRDVPYTPED